MRTYVLSTALAFSLLVCTGAAAQTIVTDRPGFANSTAVVPVCLLQLEGGYQYDKIPGSQLHSLGQLQARVAVAKRIEFSLGVNSCRSVKPAEMASSATAAIPWA